MNIKPFISIIILTILLGSCGSPYRSIIKNELFYDKNLSFQIPAINWIVSKRYDKKRNTSKHYIPGIVSYIPGSTYDVNIESINYMLIPILFDKNGDFEAKNKKDENEIYTSKQDKEQNITYKKAYTQYIFDMKCLGGVFSRNYGGSVYSATSKNYSITCGYYDTTETKNNGKRVLRIEYRYSYANPSNTHLQKDQHLKEKQIPNRQIIENNLKSQLKQIIKTIKIKNFDYTRMEQEGLIHPNKVFKSTKW